MHRQMRNDIAIVEADRFFEAGEICCISRSAISWQMRALEEERQVHLLERHGRSSRYTGRYFYEQARKQVEALNRADREVHCIAAGNTRGCEWKCCMVPIAGSSRSVWRALRLHIPMDGFPLSPALMKSCFARSMKVPPGYGEDQWRALSGRESMK